MRRLRSVTSLLGLLVVGALVAGCDQLRSPASPGTPQLGAPDLTRGNFVVSPQQGRASVDWTRFISTSAGLGQIKTFGLTAAALAPAAPSNLTFTTAGTTVTLSWSAPSGGDPATSYVVEAGSAAGLANLAAFDTGSALTSLSVNNVPNGLYFVRVKARNSAGLSTPTNEVQITVGASCVIPPAPTNLRSCSAGTTVNLNWSGSPGATSYVLEAGTSPGASNLSAGDVGPGVSFTATAPPGTYYIRVRAKSACGTSAVSNEVVVQVGSTPVLDQSFLPSANPPEVLSLPNFTGLAQTFTVGQTGTLTDVVFGVVGNYSNVRMQIRSTSGGIPTSQVLVDTTIPSTTPVPVRLSIASFGQCVNAGDVLAIVLPPVSGGNTSVALWRGKSGASATYAGGQGLRAADNGATTPIDVPVGDFAFETYVTR